MKKLLSILFLCATVLTAFSALEWAGLNGVGPGEVVTGVNNVYPNIMDTPIGETYMDGSYLITLGIVYGSMAVDTNEFGVWYDDVSPPIRVNFQQWVHVTNGVIHKGDIIQNSIIGSGVWGTPIPTNVVLRLMLSTNGATHNLRACYTSDGTRNFEGEVYKQILVPDP